MPEITYKGKKVELTQERAIRWHRELWDWLSHNPGKIKQDWPGFKKFKFKVDADCFCCEFNNYYSEDCEACPLDWSYGSNVDYHGCVRGMYEGRMTCGMTLFSLWDSIKEYYDLYHDPYFLHHITQTAIKIRDLPAYNLGDLEVLYK